MPKLSVYPRDIIRRDLYLDNIYLHASPKSASLAPRYPSLASFTRLHIPLYLRRTDLHLDWTVQTRLLKTTLEVCGLILDLYMTRNIDKDVGLDDHDDIDTVETPRRCLE